MKIDPALVANVARLAALEPSEAELDELAGQLTRIVGHFEALREIPEAVLSESPDSPSTRLRADEPRDGFPGALVAHNAPDFAHGHFVVPRIVSRN